MLLAVPLAWLQLIRERVRFLVAITGIAFAVILMMMQLGFRDALFENTVKFHNQLDADIVLISPQSVSLIAMSSFSRRRLQQALGIPGVASVSPVYLDLAIWKNPETGKPRQILVIGIDPAEQVLNIPGVLKQQDKITQSDVILFDQASRAEYGPIGEQFLAGKTVSTEVSGRRITVGGVFTLGASFAADGNMVTSDLNFLRILDRRTIGEIDVGLIKVKPETDIEQVIQSLKTVLPTDVLVFSKQDFVRFEQLYWQNTTAIGFIFTFGLVLGFTVGTIIVYQILYTDVSDHLKEYATLKAMGYRSTFLFSLVLQEAAILSGLGYIPGFLISVGLYQMTQNATALPLAMTVDRGITIFGLTLFMCILSGAVAMRKVQDADPADIF